MNMFNEYEYFHYILVNMSEKAFLIILMKNIMHESFFFQFCQYSYKIDARV